MPSVRRTARAEDDLVDLWLHVAQDDTQAADRLLEALDRRCEPLGVLRYRRQLAINNHNRVIVVVGNYYGIVTLRDFASLLGAEFL